MPTNPTFPGVHVEEIPSGVRTIAGVATSVTAFIGRARRGPVNKAVSIHSYAEYERIFGERWEESSMGYSVSQYFLNGGQQAVIARVFRENLDQNIASIELLDADAKQAILLEAVSQGSWGQNIVVRVDYDTNGDPNSILFNLKVKDKITGLTETHKNLSTVSGDSRFISNVLEHESDLIRVSVFTARPSVTQAPDAGATEFEDMGVAFSNAVSASVATDGDRLSNDEIIGSGTGSVADPKTGLFAFDEADTINILCIPPYVPNTNGNILNGDVNPPVRDGALAYVKKRRAILLVDPPSSWRNKDDVDLTAFSPAPDKDAAMYFPRIKSFDPRQEGRLGIFTPSGAIAGLIARTDLQRGVWKAPAGHNATLKGVPELSVPLSDAEIEVLNPQGVNCLRAVTGLGPVVWGARTMRGADTLADEWKYLSVRRLALYLEESLLRGSMWAEFEPNDERLWSQVRLNFNTFLQDLFRQGAFQGIRSNEAYFVKCDSETTTQNDINQGIVNIVVGFAPLKPAEFVIIKIQQLAGQVDT